MDSLLMAILLELCLDDLQAKDHAPSTVRRYKSVIDRFCAWCNQEEQRPLILERISPIALIGYSNFLKRTQKRATSTMMDILTHCASVMLGSLESTTLKRTQKGGALTMSVMCLMRRITV